MTATLPMGSTEASSSTGPRDRISELERSAERLSTILEHAPVMIDSFDEQGRCLLWNRQCERILGWSRQEIEGTEDPLSLFYPDAKERNRVLETIARADGRFREYRVQAKDGSTRVQLWADFKLPTGELISVGHDVSEQRELEEQLRQAQRLEAIGRLSGGMAHDFNNLLTVILGNVELIAAGLPSEDERLHKLVAEVRGAAERGARLIRNLLTFSRKSPLTLRAIDLVRAVERIGDTLRRLLPESIEIEVVCDRALPRVGADPAAIEQILLNLATNARDALPDGGSLRIELSRRELGGEAADTSGRQGRYARLAVSDDGEGMPAEVRERALEPFFTTKSPDRGSGLGLAIVYGLMEQHRGFVEIDSRPGWGTTVAVCFPLDGELVVATETTRRAAEPGGGAETILVAEDEAAIRDVARAALEQHGYRVLVAADGEEALGLLEQHGAEVSLVITDLVMPRMGGAELRLAARRLAPRIRFLLTTGYGAEDLSAGKEHSEPLLHKPWTLPELLARVRDVLDG